jgi:hypothetical protein
MRPYLEKTHHKKRSGRMAQGLGPEFKSQYCKKKIAFVLYLYRLVIIP